MTVEELQTQVLADSWPEPGAPENLIPQLRTYVVSALIEIQRLIKCFQYRHDSIFPSCKLLWHCGTSQLQLPRGKILRVYTVQNRGNGNEWCSPVIFSPVSLREIRRWTARFRNQWRPEFYNPPNAKSELPLGFDVPNRNSDAVSGRAMHGYYAIDDTAKRLIVTPWLQSYESLVVEWQGVKREWLPTDLVPSDPDFVRLVRLFVELEYGRRWGCQDLAVRIDAWREHLRRMYATCIRETEEHGEPVTAEEADLAWIAYRSAPVSLEDIHAAQIQPDEALITFVGSTGIPGPNTDLVASRVQQYNPVPDDPELDKTHGWHVLLGNNVDESVSVDEAFEPFADYVDAERLLLALGRKDLDVGDLGASQFAALTGHPRNLEGHSRWYSKRIGPVELFVGNGGFNSNGDVVEPAGNFEGSAQHMALHAAILRSTAIWRILVVGDPPYSSGQNTTPGQAALRWMSALPVNAVISGQSLNYERGTFGNRLHLVAGTGGEGSEGFGELITGSEAQSEANGILVLEATCDDLCFKFIAATGALVDSTCTDVKTPEDPPKPTYSVWYGRSTKTDGFVEADVESWQQRITSSRAGTYSFDAGTGYLCFAIPIGLGAPKDNGLGEGFKIGNLSVAMANPAGSPAFGTGVNGYGAETLTFDGVSYRVYRTYNTLAGAVTISIT